MLRITTTRSTCLGLIGVIGLFGGLSLTLPALAFQPKLVSVEDVALLAESDLSEQTTLVYLETRGIAFEVDVETIKHLRSQGVSEEVIQFLLKKSARTKNADEGPAPVLTVLYPVWYYGFYYAHDPGLYYGHSIPSHWIYGGRGSDHHYAAGHSFGHSARHSTTNGHSRHATNHHRSDGHANESHTGRGGGGGHRESRVGAGHSRNGQRGHGQGGRRHRGGGHRSGGHRGGHGGGHGGGGH